MLLIVELGCQQRALFFHDYVYMILQHADIDRSWLKASQEDSGGSLCVLDDVLICLSPPGHSFRAAGPSTKPTMKIIR